jgi:membrane protein
MRVRFFSDLLREIIHEWSEDKVPRLGAALAYYSIFSIAPLVLLTIAVAGMLFGQKAAEGAIVAEIGDTVGQPVATAIETMIQSASDPGSTILATLIGLVTLLFGASGVFGQLQDALNTIWKVAPKPGLGFWELLRSRFLSFTMVLGTGFLMLVSLLATAALAAVAAYFTPASLPGGVYLWQAVNWLLSFALATLLFALIYKILPDVQLAWKDVWTGAVVASLLFSIGKYLIGLYLGRGGVASAYGAAGSLVVILIWVYYSSQILLFGAELTRVLARRHGTHVAPSENAVSVTLEGRAGQGIPRSQDAEMASRS